MSAPTCAGSHACESSTNWQELYRQECARREEWEAAANRHAALFEAEYERAEREKARRVRAEQQRDEALAPGDDVTLLNALQDAEEDRDAAEREHADLRARIEALANRAQTEAHLSGDTYGAVVDVDDLRALLSPTEPTKEAGQPRHPLYLRADAQPIPFQKEAGRG